MYCDGLIVLILFMCAMAKCGIQIVGPTPELLEIFLYPFFLSLSFYKTKVFLSAGHIL